MRNRSRSRISLRMRAAISFCFFVSSFGSSANQTFAALMERSPISPMCLPAILTASAWGLRR